MVFITLASPKAEPAALARAWSRFWLAMLFVVATTGIARAEEFVVRRASIHLADHVYQLDAQIDYRFSERALSALTNGVPLVIRMDILIDRQRNWWADKEVAELNQRFEIQYHALSGLHVVRNLNSGASDAYPSLEAALRTLGWVRDLPLIDENLLDPAKNYEVSVRAGLEFEALPSPLRAFAYVTPAWWHGSDWYTWSIKR